MCVGHEHSSQGIEGQCHSLTGRQNAVGVTLSGGNSSRTRVPTIYKLNYQKAVIHHVYLLYLLVHTSAAADDDSADVSSRRRRRHPRSCSGTSQDVLRPAVQQQVIGS